MNSQKTTGLPYPGLNAAIHCPVSQLLKDMFATCREGKKDPNITITSNIEAVSADITHLNHNDIRELTCKQLAVTEKSMPDVAFRYAIVSKDSKPVLFAYFQIFNLSAKNFNLHNNKSFVRHIMGLFLHIKKARVLVSGNALRSEAPGFCYDTSELSYDEALEAVAVVADRIAAADDISATILQGFNNIHQSTAQTLLEDGYSMPWDDNVMEMNVAPAWLTLNDYIADLTRKYKARAKKVLDGAQSLTSRLLTEEELAKYQQDINTLFEEVIDKQSFVFTRSGADYVAALKHLYGDSFEVTAFFLDGKPVAFYSAFVTDHAYELFYVGFDTKLNNEYPLYFNIMLSGLERAIQLRKATLKLGRTSFDAKASLGAKPVVSNYLIKLRHLPDVAIKWFTNYFSTMEDNKWRLRNPLKV